MCVEKKSRRTNLEADTDGTDTISDFPGPILGRATAATKVQKASETLDAQAYQGPISWVWQIMDDVVTFDWLFIDPPYFLPEGSRKTNQDQYCTSSR